MAFLSGIKNTVLLSVLMIAACGNQGKSQKKIETVSTQEIPVKKEKSIIVAANNTAAYLPILQGKKIAVVANPTSVIFKNDNTHTHLVDSLRSLQIDIKKVFAPEHGFRGAADAGETVKDGIDTKTGLALISLYGKNKKPTAEQLLDVDLVLFDIQDVGVRFYTYIATLQLVMEACAALDIPVVLLDRPNPNGSYVDGPTMEAKHRSFLGMTQIPLVYGMTIGEYAEMINEEGWLSEGVKAQLTVIPLQNYKRSRPYSLPIRPSPNLPNDLAINLYPSLGFFEGTFVNAGRGTGDQFQRYGAPFMKSSSYGFKYTPEPNFGAKHPKHKGEICYGKDLSTHQFIYEINLEWLLDAYLHTKDKTAFFNTASFTKHAGTALLQQQIESGLSASEIKASWQNDIEAFTKRRAPYLRYE